VHSLHFHWPHVPYSYSLMGIILGVAVAPPLILWGLFLITQAFLGGAAHNVR